MYSNHTLARVVIQQLGFTVQTHIGVYISIPIYISKRVVFNSLILSQATDVGKRGPAVFAATGEEFLHINVTKH